MSNNGDYFGLRPVTLKDSERLMLREQIHNDTEIFLTAGGKIDELEANQRSTDFVLRNTGFHVTGEFYETE